MVLDSVFRMDAASTEAVYERAANLGPGLRLVRGARPDTASLPAVRQHLAWGPGPRAAQALMLATRARAVLDGRLAPSVEDVLALAEPILRHRMALGFAARADGVQLSEVIAALKADIA